MHSVEFTTLIRSAHYEGGLTKAELARWFQRNYWTVIRWLKGSAPQQNRKQAEEALLLLHTAIKSGQLPLQPHLTQQDRERALGIMLDAIRSNRKVAEPHMDGRV